MANVYDYKLARAGGARTIRGPGLSRIGVIPRESGSTTLTFTADNTEQLVFIPFDEGVGHIVVEIVLASGNTNTDDLDIKAYPAYTDSSGEIQQITDSGTARSVTLATAHDFDTDAMFKQSVTVAFTEERDPKYFINPPGVLIGIGTGAAAAVTATFTLKAWVA